MLKKNNIKKIKNKRFKLSKKMILIILPVVVILGVIALITTGSLSKLMGNSITSYHCIDDTWKLEGTTCSKTTTKKAELFADINQDSKIDNSDLELLNYYIENNNKADYTILSNIQLVLADINGDGTIDNFDSGMLEYYITNPDKQSKDMVCEKGFKLNGPNCELEEKIPAEVDDNSVGASNNQVVSFGYANFYKTYVGNTNVYVETSIPSEIVSEYIGTLNKLNTEYSGYLTSVSNLFLIPNKIYAEVEGDSGGVSLPAINSIFIMVYDNCCGDGSWVKQTIRHETGHRIDDATNKVIGTPLFEMQYNGHNIKYYTEKYYKAKLCDGDFCLRYAPHQGNYSYGESYWEFFADVFASFDAPALKVNDELKIVRDEVKQKFHDIYSKNSDKFKEIQNKYKNIYMINYSADSGYGNMKPQIAVYNESTKLNSNVFSKDNYDFDGWKVGRSNGTWLCYTDANKINISWTNESFCKKYDYVRLKDGANVTSLTQPDSYVTLHATWKKITNEQTSLINYVVVNDDNTYKTIATQKVPFGTSSLKPYSYKSNLKFAGWHAKRSDGYGYCYVDSDKKKASWVNQSTCNLYDYELLKDQQPFYNYSTNYSYTLEAQFVDYYTINYVIKNSDNTYKTIATQKTSLGSTNLKPYNDKNKSNFIGWYAKRDDGAGYCYTDYNKNATGWLEYHSCNKNGYVLMLDQQEFWNGDQAFKEFTLEAQFNNYKLDVKFDGNGSTSGRMYAKKIDSSNCDYTVPWPNYDKKDYGFLGWYAKRVDGLKFCNSSYDTNSPGIWADEKTCNLYGHKLIREYDIINLCNLNANVTFVAQWTKNYEVYFDANGGTGKMDPQNILYGTEMALNPNNFKKERYKFVGWNAKAPYAIQEVWYCTTSENSNKYEWVTKDKCVQKKLFKDKEKVKNIVWPGETVVMYAQWTDENSIKFDGNGATKGSMKSYNYHTAGECGMNSLPSNKFENKGYGFWGWYADTEDGRGYCYTSYDKTDAAWSDKNACSRFGHKLIDNHSSYNRAGICEVNSNVILKAQWANTFTLKFDGNGATKGSMKDQEIVYGVPTSITHVGFEKKGYVFLGWNAKRDDGKGYCYTNSAKTKKAWSSKETCRRFGFYLYKDGLKVKDTANIGGYTTMVAVWTNTFTLKFDGNGATKGSMKDQEIVYGVPTSITHVGFEKAGYAFLGWQAKRDDGKGYCYTNSAKTKRAWSSKETCRRFSYYLYKDGLKVKDTANIGGYTTMVAIWTNTFTLKFDGNGATSGSMKDQELVYGIRTKIRRNEFKKTGYVFDGWHAERSDGKWYCYTDSTKKKHSWSTKSTCEKYDYYLYKNEMNVTNTAEPGSYTTLHAKWSKAKCTQYECPKGSTSKGGECFETNISFSKVSKVKDCVCPANTTKHAGECFTTETKNVWVKKQNGDCPSGAVKHGGECFKKETREVHVNKICSQVCPKGTEEHVGTCYKKTTKDVHVSKVCTKYSS